MKPQAPQRPTSSVLSPGAILASLRANNVTPTTPTMSMTRAMSVPRRLMYKTESSDSRKIGILTPQSVMKESIVDRQYTEEVSEFSLEAPRIGLSEVRKGILVKKREKLNILGSSLNKTTTTVEENRRSVVMRLFIDPKDATPINREERDIRSRQPIKASQDLLEELRASENPLDFSAELKKSKKVTFTFNSENPEVPERLSSSMGRRIGKVSRNTFFNERETNFASQNRAFRLIAETLGPIPKIVSDGVSSVNGYDFSLNVKGREIRSENIRKMSGGTPVNNSLTLEGPTDLENKDGLVDLKQHEYSKKSTIKRLPLILSSATKINTEVPNIITLDKPSSNSPVRKESSLGTMEEGLKNKVTLVHSSSLSVLGERKGGRGHHNYNADRLRRKDDSYMSASESKLKINIQYNLSLNRGWKVIDPEQVMMDAREEYRKKIFSLLRKQQSHDTPTSIV